MTEPPEAQGDGCSGPGTAPLLLTSSPWSSSARDICACIDHLYASRYYLSLIILFFIYVNTDMYPETLNSQLE